MTINERSLTQLPVEHASDLGEFDTPDTVDVYMDEDCKRSHNTSSVRIVSSGSEMVLSVWPNSSLREFAKFILATVEEYEKL